MWQKIKEFFTFEPARNARERYDQLIVLESFSVFWKLNWSRTQQYGWWTVRLWCILWLGVSSFSTGQFEWHGLWQLYICLTGSVLFFFIAWPSVLVFSLLHYYLRLPFLFINPLYWFALRIYGYRFEDDVLYFRRVVIIRAQDRLLSEYGIDTNLRN